MTDKPILITGLSGFIAKQCALELLKHGYSVRGTVRRMAKADEARATLAKYCDTTKLTAVEADLLSDAGWADAMEGVGGVLHVASPFPTGEPKDPDELLRPAVDGTLRVLRAAVAAGVPRVVQTSSMVAVIGGHQHKRTKPFDEDDWTDADAPGITAYYRSKTLAEKAARDFVSTTGTSLHFSTVNPGFVLGPVLDNDIGTSAEVIQMLLRGKYPGTPRIHFAVVDVRDVAKMHRLALESAEPSGGRYVAVSEALRFLDIALPIRRELGRAARKVPSRELPDFLIRLIALFDPTARTILPDLGFKFRVDNSRTRRALKMEFIPVAESAPAMASSLIQLSLV
ncbi:aldehyde reductase [Jeongeupia wiesaeckerbachi]|uniref:SDR family oxidoreductase n=1 Tax=Jeongeupia wiesaeckerbachi TaxID=3051218 RepID=UPI003D805EF3